jgi:hypothetical protein
LPKLLASVSLDHKGSVDCGIVVQQWAGIAWGAQGVGVSYQGVKGQEIEILKNESGITGNQDFIQNL